MNPFIRLVKSLLLAASLGLGLASAPAQAVVGTNFSTFYWSGDCLDCTSLGAPGSTGVSGVLTLKDYTQGTPIVIDNFESLSYSGSNLVYPFSVTKLVDIDGFPDDGNPATNDFAASSIYYIAGKIESVPGPSGFEIVFDDGLFFETQTTGSWSLCAPGINAFGLPGYYGGFSCDAGPVVPADFGNAAVFTTTPVPEPGEWAMLLAGLGLIGFMRRRRAASAH